MSLEFQDLSFIGCYRATDINYCRRNYLPRIPIFSCERSFSLQQSAFATVVTVRDRLPDYPLTHTRRQSLPRAKRRGRKRGYLLARRSSWRETAETKRDPPLRRSEGEDERRLADSSERCHLPFLPVILFSLSFLSFFLKRPTLFFLHRWSRSRRSFSSLYCFSRKRVDRR